MLPPPKLDRSGTVPPGRTWIAGHEAAVSVLTEGLLSLGLLKGTLKAILASGAEKPKVAKREVEMAKQLIESLTSDFDPDKYRDEYRAQHKR